MHLLKYTQKDLKALVIYDMIDPTELESFNKHWETIITRQHAYGTSQDQIIPWR